jgi:HSP20 family protein
VPPVDIYDSKDEVVLKVEIPEVDIKDVKISAVNNVLSINGERKLSAEAKEENYYRIERTYGTFVRTFTLPTSVDTTKISAKYKDGVLRLALPKKEEAKPRQVNIEIEKA